MEFVWRCSAVTQNSLQMGLEIICSNSEAEIMQLSNSYRVVICSRSTVLQREVLTRVGSRTMKKK